MAQQRLAGKVSSITKGAANKSGWCNHDIVFENGTTAKVAFPPDVSYFPNTGDYIGAYKGNFGWILDCQNYLTDDRTGLLATPKIGSDSSSSSSGGGSPTGTSQRPMSRDDYWRGKDKYEKETRDPKIEFQTYFRDAMNMYAAALPLMATPPDTPEKLNAYIDDAFFKAQSLYKMVNKKPT